MIEGKTTMRESIAPRQDHDRRLACLCENRGLKGIAAQLDRRLDRIANKAINRAQAAAGSAAFSSVQPVETE